MRVFWSLVGLLFAATAAAWVVPAGGDADAMPTTDVREPMVQPRADETYVTERLSKVEAWLEATEAMAAERLEVPAEASVDDAAGEAVVADIVVDEPAEAPAPKDAPVIAATEDVVETGEPAAAVLSWDELLGEVIEEDESATDDEVVGVVADEAPASLEVGRDEDGVLTIGPYAVPGDGTAESPYRVPWDVLASASRTYNPRAGQTELPAWTAALDDKQIVITGFPLFPVLTGSADEGLVMLNEWDGCCIGIPPTPFDCIEVRFTEAVDLARGSPRQMTLAGRFEADPYIVQNWLVGLYLLHDAKVLSKEGIAGEGVEGWGIPSWERH